MIIDCLISELKRRMTHAETPFGGIPSATKAHIVSVVDEIVLSGGRDRAPVVDTALLKADSAPVSPRSMEMMEHNIAKDLIHNLKRAETLEHIIGLYKIIDILVDLCVAQWQNNN